MFSEAQDGQEAIEQVLKHSNHLCCSGYSLVLMDLNMPVLGGIEATQIIQRYKMDQVSPEMEIVAVTAFPSESIKQECLNVGFRDFIVKPFTLEHFIELIKT